MNSDARGTLALLAIGVAVLVAGCERPPVETVQRGFRGLAMEQVYNPRTLATQAAYNRAPAALPAADAGGPAATEAFKNVQVLTDVSAAELMRLMIAMTSWVSPDQGCAYCHAGADFASDGMYAKVVARRMLQMTRQINTTWKSHVSTTGVTCYTCHHGKPVPEGAWFTSPGPKSARGMAGNRAGQNTPSPVVGLTALPYDPLTPLLAGVNEIRVVSTTALPGGSKKSIQQTESTYALMMHMSQSLGVNCVFCHNSRSFAAWDGSTPQRAAAWYGIRMVRDLNMTYLDPLGGTIPANHHGALGDVGKVGCATCHAGAYKPLYGAQMLKDYPALAVAAGPAPPTPPKP